MAIYRNVMMNFWTDAKVADDFTPEDRYFYLYLFTNPHTNLCGCYEVSIKCMAYELGYNKETVEKLLHRFEYEHNVLRYDPNTKEVLLLNWHKYNWTTSEKFRKPLFSEIENIKTAEYKNYLINVFNGTDTVSVPYQYGSDTTDTVTDTVSVTDTKKIKKAKNIIPPTIEMVEDYINEHGYDVNAHSFMDFYDSKGWMVGKTKMKDWQAAVRTWAHNEYGNVKNKSSGNPWYDMLQKGDYS